MRRIRGQKRFTISEVAADWHELMIPQRNMRSSIGRVNEQLDPGPSRASAGPGETFSRDPQTFSWGPSGEKFFEFGVLYIFEQRRAPKRRGARGSLHPLLHPLDKPDWTSGCSKQTHHRPNQPH